nr:MAG TPA: hypothetical protein [Caudoviricetes sp.]DAN85974.1 MAG TPA: hypothetical protein [Caudoviricetes sp.]
MVPRLMFYINFFVSVHVIAVIFPQNPVEPGL